MKSKTILITYQDDLGAQSLLTFFHGIGYRVETAKVVSEMIRRVRNGKIHVILLDDEVENLLSVACPLLVLVTYFDRSEFDKNLDELDELKEQAKQKMFQKRRFDAEFLLVAGDCDTYARPEDQFWAAYILYPSISATPFLCPPGPWEVE